jgi:hypothetical protein
MSTSDLIMSILAEKPLNLMSWNVTCGAGGTLAGRKAFMLKVSGFKHQGAVVIFPNSLDGYFDIELIMRVVKLSNRSNIFLPANCQK